MSETKTLTLITKLLEVFSIFAEEKLSIAASRAFLFIAMASSDYDHPMLPSVTDVSRAIQMSPSGTSRLLSNLVESDDPLILSDKGIRDSRSESFFLTERGRMLIETALLSASLEKEIVKFFPLDLESFARSKYIERKGLSHLSLCEWNNNKTVKTSDNLMSACQSVHHREPLSAQSDVSKDSVKTHEFSNRSEALLFLCQNCLPIRPT